MKRFVMFLPGVLLLAVLGFGVNNALARADASLTLSLGQSVRVLSNGCALAVPSPTTTLVKVRCNITTAKEMRGARSVPAKTVTLSAGQRLNVSSDGCDLVIVKKSKTKVVVACQPHTVQVGASGFNFSPQQITIQAGESVHWVWMGDNHTVTSGTAPTADNQFCSPNDTNCGTANATNTGATYDHTFDTAGTFQYFCKIHGASMSVTVIVNP